MKYNIYINQLALADTDLDIVDGAILDYLKFLCGSTNPSIEKHRQKGHTWADYGKIIEDNPMLRIKSKNSLTPRIKRIRDSGYITTIEKRIAGHKRIYVRLTPLFDSLIVSTIRKPNRETEKPNRETALIKTTRDNTTEELAGSGNPTPAKDFIPVKKKKKKKIHNPLGVEIIKVFESIDLQNKTYYGNTTQREACDFLINEYGLGKVLEIIQELLPITNKRPRYEFPHISTPYQLKTNWTKLVDSSFVKKNEQTSDVAFTS